MARRMKREREIDKGKYKSVYKTVLRQDCVGCEMCLKEERTINVTKRGYRAKTTTLYLIIRTTSKISFDNR